MTHHNLLRTPVSATPKDISPMVEIGEQGLIFGAGSILARMTDGDFGSRRLALDVDQDRILALLSVACRQPLTADALRPIKAASNDWQHGDKALANLRLVFARLPRLNHPTDAYRLSLAEHLLDHGMPPYVLMKELGLDPSALSMNKYDPDEPRVPAGRGRESGRWGSSAGSADVEGTGPVSGTVALEVSAGETPSFLAGASSSIIEDLAAFLARFSVPTAVLGALVIPTPNSGGVTAGPVPDAPDIHFEKDGPAGTLRLTGKSDDGSDVVVAAQNRNSLYVDIRTGQSFGRDFGDRIYLDADAVNDAIQDAPSTEEQHDPDSRPQAATDEPKLCPAPEPDRPHGSKVHILDYEDDVHLRVNPLLPIPRGFAVKLFDPITDEPVYFDDCFRYAGDLVDGDMKKGDLADTKGEEYAHLLSMNGVDESVMSKLLDQARRQTQAIGSTGRGLKWYFAEARAAEIVRKRFEKEGYGYIKISVMKPSKPK